MAAAGALSFSLHLIDSSPRPSPQPGSGASAAMDGTSTARVHEHVAGGRGGRRAERSPAPRASTGGGLQHKTQRRIGQPHQDR